MPRAGDGVGSKESVFNEDRISVQKVKSSGDRWWWEFHNNVNVLSAIMNCTVKYSSNRIFYIMRTWQSLSRVLLFVTPWTVTQQASLSVGFSRQEYWNGLPCPSPGELSSPGEFYTPQKKTVRKYAYWMNFEGDSYYKNYPNQRKKNLVYSPTTR